MTSSVLKPKTAVCTRKTGPDFDSKKNSRFRTKHFGYLQGPSWSDAHWWPSLCRHRFHVLLEAEAIILILQRIERKDLEWVGSEILDFELTQAPDPDRVIRASVLARCAHKKICIGRGVEKRALKLEKLGFEAYDALHLACAEKGGVEVFLTTDDRLVRLAHRLSGVLRTSVQNPLIWLSEVREP